MQVLRQYFETSSSPRKNGASAARIFLKEGSLAVGGQRELDTQFRPVNNAPSIPILQLLER
jgi:hypothetical protein